MGEVGSRVANGPSGLCVEEPVPCQYDSGPGCCAHGWAGPWLASVSVASRPLLPFPVLTGVCAPQKPAVCFWCEGTSGEKTHSRRRVGTTGAGALLGAPPWLPVGGAWMRELSSC